MFWLPLAAMLAGTAIQHHEAKKAGQRSQAAIAESIERQKGFQQQGEARAMQAAQTFDPAKRQQEMEAAAVQAEQGLAAPVQQSEVARVQEQAKGVTGDVSSDFDREQALANLETAKTSAQLARMLGRGQGFSRMRQNEDVRMMDAGADIDRIGNFARGQAGVDELAIQRAGQMNQNKLLLANALSMAGMAGMAYGAGGAAKGANYSLSTGASGAPGLNAGLGSAGGVGLRMAPAQQNAWLTGFLK